jgi:hypothetical protein
MDGAVNKAAQRNNGNCQLILFLILSEPSQSHTQLATDIGVWDFSALLITREIQLLKPKSSIGR